MVGVEQWAEISPDEPGRAAVDPRDQPAHGIAPHDDPAGAGGRDAAQVFAAAAASKLDPFKDWICEQLRADPAIQSLRLREIATELGYVGGKTIFDHYVREVRPRFQVRRTFQRTIYRRGELVQCDLWGRSLVSASPATRDRDRHCRSVAVNGRQPSAAGAIAIAASQP